ncbi:Reverse transcriptase zinc-binding domain [Arabidopsis thaliana x Arabidopsis arenosa]|uniref:Reverse transcriptase zinc-binding domain n=1 Tax=Arabidopsis thaliana x Arabidopsis arenosa TaxID=1240361 RepID=A0A8T2AE02_9BRAS|nr:Reverse transcriptase zinc-binding domain [Arabidopsis thaliana x Arabidopsis arenosa]
MSAAMDRALMALSLDEEDLPFDMPDLPQYSCCEKNSLSVVGRLLNPDHQSMSGLIMNMPRKWQKSDRIRGVALSNEKFQFIFRTEHDLVEIMEKGAHTFNEWSIAIERWTESPPQDSLQFIPLWVQIRNIPVNYYTRDAIMLLGELIGQVKELIFDPDKPQSQEFVRVKIRFDVSKPLRKSKVVNLPKGKTATILFHYERVQKRCYHCQRLTHEQDVCPILIKQRQDQALERRLGKKVVKPPPPLVLKATDPLFGVLREDQVGIHPIMGRPRIDPVVLEGMRQYILVAEGEERKIREERVKLSVADAEKDPMVQKTVLRLEPAPLVSNDYNKEKGIVFGYESLGSPAVSSSDLLVNKKQTLGSSVLHESSVLGDKSTVLVNYSEDSSSSLFCSTEHVPGFFEAGSSGTKQRKSKNRRRPHISKRSLKGVGSQNQSGSSAKKEGLIEGLGRPQDLTVQRLLEMRKKHFPEILFLMETMNVRNVIVDIQAWLGYDRVFTVDPIGRCGGLALFWKKGISVDFISFDKNLLDMEVVFGDRKFFVSGVYGNPRSELRHIVWERVTRIGLQRTEPWCMLGDFNEILHNGEKIGGPRRSESSFVDFANMIEVCGMNELPSSGNSFSWGGRRGDMWIQCKLDRCFGNKKWFNLFPVANQNFLEKKGSDHRPVLLHLLSSQDTYRGSFRFDKWMLHQPLVHETVKLAWNASSSLFGTSVSESLRRCRKALSKWKRANVTNSKEKINQIQKDIEIEHSALHPSFARMSWLHKEMVVAHREEESFWKQKCRKKWQNSGDRNTKYFHASVKADRSRNGLVELTDDEGITHRSEASMGDVATSYFQALFSSSYPSDPSELFEDFIPRVTEDMNKQLLAKVSKEEVRVAVFSVKSTSAPGADGMTGLFFQQYWDIVGEQLTSEVLRFFDEGVFQKEWNFTQLALIPKKVSSLLMSDLRPISLCSVIYKVISKIVVSRLKPLLPELVSPTQSAFVEERLISDNIIIAHETVHGLRTHPTMSKEFMAIKTDMSKAFDRVEWSYLRLLLIALGFDSRWVELVMVCVSTVTYTVLINGQPHGLVVPQRGLRQGDPLSPFLFVLCTEGLTHMLNRAEHQGLICGMRFSEDGPSIHHLLFADDSLFVCKAEKEQVMAIQNILDIYGKATGQYINKDKSSVTFGTKISEDIKAGVKIILGINCEGGAGTYLGLPECFSGSKRDMLDYIHEKLKNRLSGWFAKTLSLGGKEILLKTVAMAMPVYAMSCFRLPKGTCESLSSAMSSFWWSSLENQRKIHWIAWDRMCLTKEQGGLGFKDIALFNQALLAKQAWRCLQVPDCLFTRFLKSRYFNDSSFLQAVAGNRPSFAWRSILHGRDLLQLGLKQMIGDGASLKVWTTLWLDDVRMRAPFMKNYIVDLELSIKDLMDQETRTWDPGLLEEHFFPRDAAIILKIKPVLSSPDFFTWKHNKSGDYSVRSGYWLACQEYKKEEISFASQLPSLNGIKDQIWKLQAPSKIKIFIWKVVSGAIPVAESLNSRGMNVDLRCQLCGAEGESSNHILFACPLARQVWALSGFPFPEEGFDQTSIYQNIHLVLSLAKSQRLQLQTRRSLPWIFWLLWKTRNNLVFDGRVFLISDLMKKIIEDSDDWFLAQEVDARHENSSSSLVLPHNIKWHPPAKPWLKCNVSVVWDRVKGLCGVAWVLRNSLGNVLLHSRHSLVISLSKDEADFRGCLWAMESMKSLNVHRVVFAVESKMIVGAMTRPAAWPSFKAQSLALIQALSFSPFWRISLEVRKANQGAFLIAKSVIMEDRSQSYVAQGYPFWLQNVFEIDKCFTLLPVAVSKNGDLYLHDNEKRLLKYYPKTNLLRCISKDTWVISPIVENLLPLRPPKTNFGYRSRSQELDHMPGSRISKFLSRIQPGIPTILFTSTLESQVVYRYFLVSSRSS